MIQLNEVLPGVGSNRAKVKDDKQSTSSTYPKYPKVFENTSV